MLPVSPQLKLEYIIYNSARNTMYIIIFIIITLPVIRAELNGSLEEVVFIPEITLSNINCLHVNHALSDENSVHMILCQGCDLLHLKVTRSDSGWRKDWMENLTNAPGRCKYVEENFITEAVFMAADRNACSLLYLYGKPSRIVGLNYRVSSDGIVSRRPTSSFTNSGLGICRGLYYFNTQHHYTVLIADESPYSGVPHSGRAIWSLSVDSNTTERLARFEDHPRDFSSDPSNNTNVFVITNNNLKKLVFDGSKYSQAQFVYDVDGVKVLALTSTTFFIVPFKTESGIVSVHLNPASRQTQLKQHTFTSLDFHRPSRTIFLSTETKIFYNVTRNTTQPTALPVSSTTTKITTITHRTTMLLHTTTKPVTPIQPKKDTEPTSTWSYYITSQGTDTFSSLWVIGILGLALVVIIAVVIIVTYFCRRTKTVSRSTIGTFSRSETTSTESPLALEPTPASPLAEKPSAPPVDTYPTGSSDDKDCEDPPPTPTHSTGAQMDAGNQRFEEEPTASEPLLLAMSPPEQASNHYQRVNSRLAPQFSLPPTDDTDQPWYPLDEVHDDSQSSRHTGEMNNHGEQDDGENPVLQNQLNEFFADAEPLRYESAYLEQNNLQSNNLQSNNPQSDNLEHTSDFINHTTVV